MREIKVRVKRENKYQEYIVPVEQDAIVSIMNVLEYIYQNIDSTLAFFHHAACKQAACGKCLVKANGKTVLACKVEVVENEITLEPWCNNVVRDLICK